MNKPEVPRIELPRQPSDELKEIVRASEFGQKEALIYGIAWVRDPLTGIQRKAVRVTCTGCGETYFEPYVPAAAGGKDYGFLNNKMGKIHTGDETACEECGAKTVAVRAGGIRGIWKDIAADWPSELRQVEGKACFLGWRAMIEVNREGDKRIVFDPWEGAVLSDGKVFRYAGHVRNIGGTECTYGEFRRRERLTDEWQECTVTHVPRGVLDGTEAENSRWDKYCRSGVCYPISFIKKWTQQPVLEAIVETGGARLITDAIENEKNLVGWVGNYRIPMTPIPDISRKERRPAAALGLARDEYATAIRKRWPFALVKLAVRAKKEGVRITEADADDIMRLGDRYTAEMYESVGAELMRTVHYLLRQREKTKQKDLITWHYYRDYLNMAEKNGETMQEVRYPRDLIVAHDREVKKYEEKKDERNKAEFDERAKKLLALAWEKDGLLIRPAMSAEELRVEGRTLSHCVASYAARMRKGETAILFIRRAEEPEQSYYTLEFNESRRKVEQNRGRKNCARTPEVRAFEEAWLAHVMNDLSRSKDGAWKERKKNERSNDETAA